MEALKHFPFTKLAVPPDEEVLWYANNPTFHRGLASEYGIAISNRAVYLFSPFLLSLARWRRYPLSEIQLALFRDSYWFPKLVMHLGSRTVTFRTPYDGYQDEMDFDRKNLAHAAQFIEQRRSGA